MNANCHPRASPLVTATASLAVHAQAQAHTRHQADAHRGCSIRGSVLHGRASWRPATCMKLIELYPDWYPKAATAGATRACTVAELQPSAAAMSSPTATAA